MPSHRVPSAAEANDWSRRLAERRERGEGVLDLADSNPTRTGLSPLAQAAVALAAVGPLGYAPEPRGAAAARAAVAAALADRGPAADPERLVLTASTSEAYGLILKWCADPGEAVLAPVPGYPLFEPLARAEGVTLRTYPLRFDGAWHLDRAAFEAAIPGARAVIVVEPGNPTGSVLDPADRAFVEAAAARHGAAIVADEVFGDFPLSRTGAPLPTWRGNREVLTFVLGGLSKRCGLPHLKLAWIALDGPAPRVAEALAGLEWLADLTLNVGSPVQAAAGALLALRHGFRERVRERSLADLDVLDAFVAAHPACSRLPAAGGWTALLRLPAARDDERWALGLLGRGVAAHPGHFYDLEGGEFLAISLVVEPSVLERGLAVLGTLLDEA